jgi:hypothetical protein
MGRVTVDELYMVTVLFMLMAVIQKPTLQLYFSITWLFETPFFPETVSLGRLELIYKFLHFTDNNKKWQFYGDYIVFKICPLVKCLNERFQSLCLPGQNITIYGFVLQRKRLTFIHTFF